MRLRQSLISAHSRNWDLDEVLCSGPVFHAPRSGELNPLVKGRYDLRANFDDVTLGPGIAARLTLTCSRSAQ